MLSRAHLRCCQPRNSGRSVDLGFRWYLANSRSRCLCSRAPIPRAVRESLGNKVDENDLFSYKAQRWLWNEPEQLRRRHVKFDLASLIRVVEEVIGRDVCCTEITKLSEGNFNKTFLVTMRDGLQLLARVPNPNAGSPHYTTASEVRDRLQIPVPKILAYNTRATSSDVGAEYIIMEKCPGVELGRVWDKMPGKQRFEIVKQLASFQSRLFEARFDYYGSLYYANDIPDMKGTEIDGTFCVGPTTSRSWFDDRRSELDIDRGPWKSAEEVMIAITKRESACIDTFTGFQTDRQQGIFNGPGGFHPTKASKNSVLRDFLCIMPHILPKDDVYAASVLWHNDLHSDNIFVDKDNPTVITGIIDWQGVHLDPAFLQVHHPALIEYDGPTLKGFEKPRLTSNFEELDNGKKQAARTLHTAQSIWALFEIRVQKEAPELLRTLRYRDTLPCQIMNLIRSTFDDGEAYIQDLLATAAEPQTWPKLVGTNGRGDVTVASPLVYTESQRVEQKLELDKWEKDVARKARVIEEVGAYTGWDGAVLPDEYTEVSERLQKAKMNFLEVEAKSTEEREQWIAAWPFKDSVDD